MVSTVNRDQKREPTGDSGNIEALNGLKVYENKGLAMTWSPLGPDAVMLG